MAKRFIDTNLFNDPWFMDLRPMNKLFFIYLITNCDHAGIIDLNIKLAEFQTGIKGLSNSLETVRQELDNRLIKLENGYYFIPKFVTYQYPKGLSINVKAQFSVINRLKSFNLFDEEKQTVKKELSNSCLTVQDKDIDIDKDMDKDIDYLIEYFNKVTDKSIGVKTEDHRKHIRARLKKFKLSDLISVIDIKNNHKWFVENGHMNIETLFRNDGKVDTYLNWKEKKRIDTKTVDEEF